MPDSITQVLGLLLSALLCFALIVFKVTTYQIPIKEDERLGDAYKRLWRAYRGNLHKAILSAWFWALAGMVTSACIVSVLVEGR